MMQFTATIVKHWHSNRILQGNAMQCLSNKFNNNKENNMDKQELYGNMNVKELYKYSVTSKEVIDRDTIWLVYYDEDNDELYRMRVEKVKERWNREAEFYADKYNDEKEGYR